MDKRLRQRGWSIQDSSDDHHSEGHSQANHGNSSRRNRAESDMTEPSLSEAEKLQLLNSAFTEDVGEHTIAMSPNSSNKYGNREERDDSNFDDEEDYVAMFGNNESAGSGGNNSDPVCNRNPKKRRKIEMEESKDDGIQVDGSISHRDSPSKTDDRFRKDREKPKIILTRQQQNQLDLAKSKMSKWAARLFDPNRPRGLVEPPKVIPLNDEFLTAFGKREKEYDDIAGREIEIDKTSLDVIDISDDDGCNKKKTLGKIVKKDTFSEMAQCKVKISNLAYATKTKKIASTCGIIGPVVDVNLIVDADGQSTGRAYVVFEDHETAVQCVANMNEKPLEGRTLRVSLASSSAGKKKEDAPIGGGVGRRKDSRYWERDISTKCNRCGEIGHTESNCTNEEKLRPCCLCASVGHDMWSCPQKSVCFNCGIPGHVSRDCRQRRNIPKRSICTVCYHSDHHRWACPEKPWNVPSSAALCMECGKVGHFMCSDMRWYFGLNGMTCYNCGLNHHGNDCKRPVVDVCAKNIDIANQEIERADAFSLTEQLTNQKSKSNHPRGRDRHRSDGNERPKSMPPPTFRSNHHRRF